MLQPEKIATVDYESFYSKKLKYSLSHCNVESYVRDSRFQIIGVGVDYDGQQFWQEEEEHREWAKTVDWSVTGFCAHNTNEFDGPVAAWKFGIKPCIWLDTLCMARVYLPVDQARSLDKLMEYFGLGKKGTEVVLADGMRREDFDEHDWAKYGMYCLGDVQGCKGAFFAMVDSIPEEELWLIDTTCRMATEPIFEGDVELLKQVVVDEQKRKRELLERVLREVEGQSISADDTAALKKVLMSNDKFARLLEYLGVEAPQKVSAKKSAKAGHPVLTYAFAKSDVGMQALLEHEEDDVRFLAEARVGIKSTIDETRAQRFLGMAQRGPMVTLLKYHGAHTSRWSGAGRLNMQNLRRGGKLRDAMRAPEERA